MQLISHWKTVLLTIDLCHMSTTLHSDSDVDSSKTLLAQQQNWLQELKKTRESMYAAEWIYHSTSCAAGPHPGRWTREQMLRLTLGTDLVLEGGWLHHLQGSAVHLDQAIPPLAVGNCCGGFLWQNNHLWWESTGILRITLGFNVHIDFTQYVLM